MVPGVPRYRTSKLFIQVLKLHTVFQLPQIFRQFHCFSDNPNAVKIGKPLSVNNLTGTFGMYLLAIALALIASLCFFFSFFPLNTSLSQEPFFVALY